METRVQLFTAHVESVLMQKVVVVQSKEAKQKLSEAMTGEGNIQVHLHDSDASADNDIMYEQNAQETRPSW